MVATCGRRKVVSSLIPNRPGGWYIETLPPAKIVAAVKRSFGMNVRQLDH